jgi:hypothetical protein
MTATVTGSHQRESEGWPSCVCGRLPGERVHNLLHEEVAGPTGVWTKL